MLNFPTSKLNFAPMLHGNAADKIQWFQSQIPNFPGWSVTHLLSFNEPDVRQARAHCVKGTDPAHSRSDVW